jgi:hypothetical protein
MGGNEIFTSPISKMKTVYRSRSKTRQGRQKKFVTGQQSTMDGVIACMVEEVIGHQVLLHSLLGPSDFMFLNRENNTGVPVRQQWSLNGGPFQVRFDSHLTHYEYQNIIIQSTGTLRAVDGRKIDLLMELNMERVSVSLKGAAMQWVMKKTEKPLILDFDCGPEVFSETAFSFDIGGMDSTTIGLHAGCGFLAIAD